MSQFIDQPVEIVNGVFYTSVAQHRINVNNEKSKWIININKEFECFKISFTNKWYIDLNGWGVFHNDNSIGILGQNSQNENLYFAKFIDSNSNNYWHGWPADYRRKVQDRPPISVLQEWRDNGYIKKHQIAKICGGKRCTF